MRRVLRWFVLFDGVDRHDVIVTDGRRRPGLPQKPLPRCGVGRQRGRQHLDRHHPAKFGVVGLENDPHPSVTDDFAHVILPESSERVGLVGRLEEVERHRVVFGRLRFRSIGAPGAHFRRCVTQHGVVQQAVRLLVRLQQQLNAAAELGIAGAGAIEKGVSLVQRVLLQSFQEDVALVHRWSLLSENSKTNLLPPQDSATSGDKMRQKNRINSASASVPSRTEFRAEPSFGVNP